MRRIGSLVVVLLACAPPARAQSVADSVQYFATSPGPLGRWHLLPYGDLRLRYDRIEDRPGIPEDFDHERATVRTGLSWAPPGAGVTVDVGVRASVGSGSNTDSWLQFQNELPDTVEFDRLSLKLANAAGDLLLAGKAPLALRLTEMPWDADLRPVGVTVAPRGVPVSGWIARLGLGGYARSRLDLDDGRVGTAQLAVLRGEDAVTGGDAILSYLGFTNTDVLARRGLGRQNALKSTPGGLVYAADFRVLSLQAAVRGALGIIPWSLRVEGLRNLGVDHDRDGVRTRLAVGGAGVPAGVEVGWVYQRIEREAVLGAFNSDDWWFHSRAHGNQAWITVGSGTPITLKLAGFIERRDDLSKDTRRLTIELRGVLPPR
jgi:hypothetical protein